MEDAERARQRIRAEVLTRLRHDGRLDGSDVHADHEDGRLVLSGTARSAAASRAAAEIAASVPGVGPVENRLSIRRGEAPARDERPPAEDELRRRVGAALREVAGIDTSRLRVTVSGATVVLEGAVDFVWQKYRLSDLAAAVEGAAVAADRVEVEPLRPPTDEDLRADVREELVRSSLVDAQFVEVEAKDGVVTLHGTLRSRGAATAAEAIAAGSRGVKLVVNELDVAAETFGEEG